MMDIWNWRCSIKAVAKNGSNTVVDVVDFGTIQKAGGSVDWEEMYKSRLEMLESGVTVIKK